MTEIFTLLGSACGKAAHKMLMKLTPVVNFTNILQYSFAKKLQSQTDIREELCKTISYKKQYEKAARKMSVKLTPWKSILRNITFATFCDFVKIGKLAQIEDQMIETIERRLTYFKAMLCGKF